MADYTQVKFPVRVPAIVSSQSPTIQSKLTLYVLLFSVVFGVLFSAIQLRLDYQQGQEKFHSDLNSVLHHQSGQLSLALQQYHSEAIQTMFEGIMLNESIIAVEVEDELSGYIQHRGMPSEELLQPPDYIGAYETGLMGTTYTSDGLEKIGTLRVWVDKRLAQRDFHSRAAVISAIEVARAVVLALVLVFVLRLRLVSPLRNLTEKIRGLNPENSLTTTLEDHSNLRELEDLVAKINSLLASIEIEMQRRRQAEKRARYLNDKLEEKVRARTKELKDSNSQLQTSIDELQRTQQLLLQAQRMASLGHLAAGIAHEINNPVAVVYSNIATLSEYTTELIELADQFQLIENTITDEAMRQSLSTMRKAIDLDFVREDAPDLVKASQSSLERVRNIVAELKTFAIQEGQAKRTADLFELMQQAVTELKLEEDDRIRLDINMSGIPKVDCVTGQIRLAFRHILDNARDAIPAEGRIEIAAAQLDDKVQVVVKDSGEGMDAEVLACAINPFYTNKEIGKGTGLGLTVAFNVMMNHGGSLDISSVLGSGTTITFTIPIVG